MQLDDERRAAMVSNLLVVLCSDHDATPVDQHRHALRLRRATRRRDAPAMASPDKKSFLLRIDPALWAEIERLAAAELRSANAQVEYLLRDALAARRGIAKPATSAAARRKR